MKKILCIFTFLILIYISVLNVYSAPWINLKLTYDGTVHNYSAESVYLYVDGNEIDNLIMPPIIINGNTLVPAREVFEPAGAVVDWKKETNEVYIAYDNSIVILKINSKTANVNGVETTLSVPAKIINNKTMIPIRFIAEAFGFDVEWNNKERKINIDSKKDIKNDNDDIVISNGALNITETMSEETSEISSAEVTTEITTETTTNDFNKYKEQNFNNYLSYNSNLKRISISKEKLNIDIKQIKENDDYLNKKYTFLFPYDYSSIINEGKYIINDTYLDSIVIQYSNGNTNFIINEKDIYAYNIEQDNNYIYISCVLPEEKYKKIVVVDAGHGGHDGGSEGNGLLEKDINLDISLRLIRLLMEDKDIKVYAVRLTDVFFERPERAAFGNKLGDLFISVHTNYFTSDTANGTEVWYNKHSNDDIIGFSSEQFAEIAQKNLVDALKSKDRGTKEYDFDVLTLTKIPAILCEIGFLTNYEESKKLDTEQYRQSAADAIYKSVLEAFEIYSPVRK